MVVVVAVGRVVVVGIPEPFPLNYVMNTEHTFTSQLLSEIPLVSV